MRGNGEKEKLRARLVLKVIPYFHFLILDLINYKIIILYSLHFLFLKVCTRNSGNNFVFVFAVFCTNL